MNDESRPSPGDHRAFDDMTAALRVAGASESAALPPEVRRSTLQALWVADATRYETRSTGNARLLRLATALVAAVALVGLCGVLATLTRQAWLRSNDPATPYPAARTPPAPATVPADTQPTSPDTGMAAAPSGPVAVMGKVVFLGTPPEADVINLGSAPECRTAHGVLLDESLVVGKSGGLANVVVSIANADGSPLGGNLPSAPAIIDQIGCRYVPHVLAVMTGQPITVKNSDPFLHNVHSLAINNPAFNFGQPNVNPGYKVAPMKVAERFRIKCDLHPWMSMHVSVFEHPYFAVAGADGGYVIAGKLPMGTYQVTAWHEKLGEKQVYVVVKDGNAVTADFVFDESTLPAK